MNGNQQNAGGPIRKRNVVKVQTRSGMSIRAPPLDHPRLNIRDHYIERVIMCEICRVYICAECRCARDHIARCRRIR